MWHKIKFRSTDDEFSIIQDQIIILLFPGCIRSRGYLFNFIDVRKHDEASEKIFKMVSMHRLFILLVVVLAGCNANNQPGKTIADTGSLKASDPIFVKKDSVQKQPAKQYSNNRFKDVTVMKTAEHTFLIKGKAQIFEANLSWVVEDGHDELKEGFQTADAGAPEWGNFTFSITVAKKRPNSTLHLILFESSAKDGSRQHELPIFLY